MGRLPGADHHAEVVGRLTIRLPGVVDLTVESQRVLDHRAVELRRYLVEQAITGFVDVDAPVGGEELVGRGEGAGQLGGRQLDQAEVDPHPVDEVHQCFQRSPVGGADCDQRTGVFATFEDLQVVPRDQPTHRVAVEDELGALVTLPLPPCQLPLGNLLQPSGVVTVREAPVVPELEEIAGPVRGGWLESNRPLQPP